MKNNIFLLFPSFFFFITIIHGNQKLQEIDSFDQTLFDWTSCWASVAQCAKEKHYKIESIEKAMIASIDAFVSSLDPHSSFLDPKAYETIMEATAGEFCGIGIMINNMKSNKDKFLTIVDLIPDGPAHKSGLQQYDKIVEVDSQTLEDLTTAEAIKLLKGPKGTKVTVKVLREGSLDLHIFTITRDTVKEQQSLCFYIPEKNMYYLSLSTFAQNSTEQLSKLLTKAQKNNPKGLILDLRNNSGGLLSTAIEIAGLFLDKDSVVVTTKNNKGATVATYKTDTQPIKHNDLIMCILINNYTASAAEVLAGALKVHADKKDQKHPLLVFIVGTPSFGKGSVQEVMPIGKNCALKLTTSLYFLPYNTLVQGVGITPDIHVERSTPPSDQTKWLTESYGRESSLPHFIDVEKKEKNKKEKGNMHTPAPGKHIENILKQDNQLKEAINIVSLIYHGKKNLQHVVTDRKSGLLFLQRNYVCNDTLHIEEIKL